MRNRKKNLKDFEEIERSFFDIDEEKGQARIYLHFDRPSDMFDANCLSKTPITSDDFDKWLQTAFEIIPKKYQIALDISFDESEGYTPEALEDIFRKNLLLSAKSLSQSIRARDRIAMGLIAGFCAFNAMMLINKH